jgi:serine/threonine-protein kinase
MTPAAPSPAPSPAPSAALWRALEPLLDAALGATGARAAVIIEACTDAAMRHELTTMLADCGRIDRDDRLFSEPAVARFASLWEEPRVEDEFATALADRYDIAEEVGRGGMGVVYRAHDRRYDRAVALKVLRIAPGRRALMRFRREIAFAATLVHPNILPLLDSGEDAGRLWYVMPFVEGETLGARLRREGQLELAEVVRLLRQIAAGLEHAHACGVVHRDLKPDNVLLSDGRAIVADFGIAKAFASSRVDARDDDGGRTTDGVRLGTPVYMAPEQCAGDPAIDHRADLYALGVIAYQLIAGVVPFAQTSRQALLTAHLVEPPPALSRYRRRVPVRLQLLVTRLLAKRAADRPSDAAEVRVELASLESL